MANSREDRDSFSQLLVERFALFSCLSKEISSTSKDRKGLTKSLNCGGIGEIIRRCDIDEIGKYFVDALAGQGFCVDRPIDNVLPRLEVETDSGLIGREGWIVSKERTVWTGAENCEQRCGLDEAGWWILFQRHRGYAHEKNKVKNRGE